MLARYLLLLHVRPYVTSVTKRLNVGSCKQCCTIAQGLCIMIQKWQLLNVLLRLTHDRFALFVQH